MTLPPFFQPSGVEGLFAYFPAADDLPSYQIVSGDEVPSPYNRLLVHKRHMTITVESHHGSLVDVRILAQRHEGLFYARKILLALQSNSQIVQFGLVRINLAMCRLAVRAEILKGRTPLGRILIQNKVLRRIEPYRFLRVGLGPPQQQWFGLDPSDSRTTTYGRLGIIYCDNQPAVEVLEIVAPEPLAAEAPGLL
jgi:hypothetical protein